MAFARGVLESYFLNPKSSDVTICATTSDGVCLRIPSHRLVLSSLSPVFEKMFEPDKFEEGKSRFINIKVEGDEDVARSFIRFFYCGNVQNENLTLALGLLKTSHLYKVERLITRSEQMILKALTLDNVCRVYEETEAQGSAYYLEAVFNLLLRCAFIIFQQENHISLSETVMSAILSSDLLNVLNENQVADALWKWGCWRCVKSGRSLSSSDIALNIRDLSRCVRWGLVTSKERYVEEETLRALIQHNSEVQNQVRKPDFGLSLVNFAEVFTFGNFSRVCLNLEETRDLCDKDLVSFCTDRDILLIGFELRLLIESSNIRKMSECFVWKLNDMVLNLSTREIANLDEEARIPLQMCTYHILFESSKPIPINRMYDYVLRIEPTSTHTWDHVYVPFYSLSKALNCEPGDSSRVNFIIQSIVSPVNKFYFPTR